MDQDEYERVAAKIAALQDRVKEYEISQGLRDSTDTVVPRAQHLRALKDAETHQLKVLRDTEALFERRLQTLEMENTRLIAERFRLRSQLQKLQDIVHIMEREKNSPAIPKALWKKLAALCHPDKHDGSALATEVMAWLNANRPK